MLKRSGLFCAAVMAAYAVSAVSPTSALTAQECSAKYQAAKTAGTLNGQKWNDFRKAQCSDEAVATPAAAAPKSAEAKPATAADAKPATAPVAAAGNIVFPKAIDPKYARETAAKSRLHTCVDQYNANKVSNGNGGLKWIQKGGGYFSECNKRLKGAA